MTQTSLLSISIPPLSLYKYMCVYVSIETITLHPQRSLSLSIRFPSTLLLLPLHQSRSLSLSLSFRFAQWLTLHKSASSSELSVRSSPSLIDQLKSLFSFESEQVIDNCVCSWIANPFTLYVWSSYVL